MDSSHLMDVAWFFIALACLLIFLAVFGFLMFIVAGGFKKMTEKPSAQDRIEHEPVIIRKLLIEKLIIIMRKRKVEIEKMDIIK